MVFGRNMVSIDAVSLEAPRGSDAWYVALLQQQFPGPFLPLGAEHVIRTAEPYFALVECSSGRLDYIETIRQWPVREAQRAQGAAEGSARSSLPHRPRIPAGVHLWRERQQRVLRARAAGPLPARVRER
jgi:hypothetical protein